MEILNHLSVTYNPVAKKKKKKKYIYIYKLNSSTNVCMLIVGLFLSRGFPRQVLLNLLLFSYLIYHQRNTV